MKLKPFILFFLLALIACEGDVVNPALRGRPIELSAQIEGLKTRVSNSSWEKDDAIGIYMFKSGGTLASSTIRENVKYTTTGSYSFLPANELQQIIFPFDGSNVDFIGYYPYNENIANHIYQIDLSNQASQSQIDLLYSNNARQLNDKNPNVAMQFTHQLSKVVLNIEHSSSVDLSTLKVIISNASIEASFNLATGTLSPSTKQGDIPFRMDTDGSLAEAIIMPQANLSDMKLWFVIGDDVEVYNFSLGEVLEINAFEPATKYTYNVTLFTNETTVFADGMITPWIEVPSANVVANRTGAIPPVVKGSKQAPFTVAETQVSQGENQAWVEGYIVGSFSSSTINSFIPGVTTDTSASNLALADNQSETGKERVIPVQLTSGSAIREELNLKDNPANFNKRVKIKGKIASYYSVMGLRDTKEYEFTDE